MALKRRPFISQLFNGSVWSKLLQKLFTSGSAQAKGFGDKTRVSLHYHMNLSPFTKDFRGGDLLRVICIFGDSAHSRATLEFKSRVNLTVYQHAVEGNAAGQLSLLSAFAVPVSRLHIYLVSVERQSFFICDGIQTLDMISLGLGPNKDRFSS